MKNCNQGLKMLALIAKKRLKGEIGRTEQNKFFEIKENVKIISREEDEKLYKQLCLILKDNKDVFNPIGRLIDYKKYNNLNKMEQERYFFVLADKYSELKRKYEKEHSMVI
ncbi:MAG: hypothetical protein PHQ62_00935 [Clostridia bacterium]|nr:hypothetical protein [Clostridia bacterium]